MKNLEHEGFFQRGIQTFMKSDYVGLDELEAYDAAVVGVPLDYGASYRQGASLGPKSIREHSYWDAIIDREYIDLESEEVLASHQKNLADLGDIHISPSRPLDNQQRIMDTTQKIREKTFPLIIGGDHSIAYSTIQGCLAALTPEKRESFGVLHFDAHLDMERPYLDMPDAFHGNPFSKLFDEKILKGENHYAIGQRGVIPKYLYDYARDQKVNLFTAPHIRRVGLKQVMNQVIGEMREKYKAVYVSFDIDCIDPSEVKGTGTPLEGGLSSVEVQQFIRSLNSLPIVGFELVEVAPELDKTGFTSIVSCNLLWNFLAFGLNTHLSSTYATTHCPRS